MRKIILLALIACLLNASPTGALADVTDGQETQNGGGAAEQNFAYALAILDPLLSMCMATSVCVTAPEHHEIVQKILLSLDDELKNSVLLRFESGKKDPGRFWLDGQVRIASTGSSVGSTIYINRDLIYRRSNGQVVPYSVNEALGVLLHELGHHQDIADHDVLDIIGGKVRSFFELKQDRLTVDTFSDFYNETDISLSVFHTRKLVKPHAHSSLFWLNVGSKVFNLNAEIESKLSCPAGFGDTSQTLLGYRFSNMHWGDRVEIASRGGIFLGYPLEAQVWLECEVRFDDDKTYYIANRYRATITFPFIPDGHGLIYKQKSLQINLTPME